MYADKYKLQQILDRCCDSDPYHANLLNLFYSLECLGAQKIHRFLRWTSGAADQDQLEHAAEEARHAAFFARKARSLTQGPDKCYIRAGKRYFRGLELEVNRAISSLADSQGPLTRPSSRQYAYVLTTLLIELRARYVYEEYQRTVANRKLGFSLKQILREEERHLTQMTDNLRKCCPHADDLLTLLTRKENVLFGRMLDFIYMHPADPQATVVLSSSYL